MYPYPYRLKYIGSHKGEKAGVGQAEKLRKDRLLAGSCASVV